MIISLNLPYYVIDTDVLLQNPYIIDEIQKGCLVFLLSTLYALEKEAISDSFYERNARIVLKLFKNFQRHGSLHEGIRISEERFVHVIDDCQGVIALAHRLQKEGKEVVLLSNVVTTAYQASAQNINVQSYTSPQMKKDLLYKGWRIIAVPAIQLKQEIPEDLLELIHTQKPIINEYIVVESQHNSYNHRIFRYIGGKPGVKEVGNIPFSGPIAPKNIQQIMALDALFDSSISLLTLIGAAGTGKTLLSLFAGLQQTVHDDEYQRIFVARPVVPLGKDIGYLPGDLKEKMHLWMQPVYDNIAFIMRSSFAHQHLQHIKSEGRDAGSSHRHGHNEHRRNKGRNMKAFQKEQSVLAGSVEDLIEEEKLTLEAITYMRGRSLAHQYIIIDEAQNLTLHEIKTIVSRVGHNSKIVLCGDPDQIDTSALDFFTNGLTVVNQKFKGQSIYATVLLEHSERSELSRLAAQLL